MPWGVTGPVKREGLIDKDVFLSFLCGLPVESLEPVLGQALFDAVRSSSSSIEAHAAVSRDALVVSKVNNQAASIALPFLASTCAESLVSLVSEARCLRMDEDAAHEFCFGVLVGMTSSSLHQHGPRLDQVTVSQLERVFAACFRLVFGGRGVGSTELIDPASVSAAASGALALGGSRSGGLTLEGYSKFSKAWPALHDLLSSLIKVRGTNRVKH